MKQLALICAVMLLVPSVILALGPEEVKEVAEAILLNNNILEVRNSNGAVIAKLAVIDLLQNNKVDEYDLIVIEPTTSWGVSIKVGAHTGLISYVLLPHEPFTPINFTAVGERQAQEYVYTVLGLAKEQTKFEIQVE